MLLFIGSNIFVLIKMRKNIKYKNLVTIVYFLICLFSKDILQSLFDISNMVTLIVIGFMDSNFVKVISILITLFNIIFIFPLLPTLLFAFLIVVSTDNDVYEDTHYYCDNNYEAYTYSEGAMDSFNLASESITKF